MVKIKQGDTIKIIAGDDKGRTGKVFRVVPEKKVVLVEGINIQKKHRRSKKEGEKGQVVEKPGPISISNIKLVCPKCGKPTRVGHKVRPKDMSVGKGEHKTKIKKSRMKVRICKKCQAVI